MDSLYYGIPDYSRYLKEGLARLTRDGVNGAIRKHLRADRLDVVLVTSDGDAWKKRLASNEPSPMKYNSPKPDEILAEDRVVASLRLPFTAGRIRVVPVDQVFE